MPSFSAVIHKPGKKFAPKSVPRRNGRRTFSEAVSVTTVTPPSVLDPAVVANPPVGSAHTVSQNAANFTTPSQLQSVKNISVVRQENGPEKQTDVATSPSLTDSPYAVITATPASDSSQENEGRQSLRKVTATESLPTLKASVSTTGSEKRTTRASQLPLAGTKRKATESTTLFAPEHDLPEGVHLVGSTSTIPTPSLLAPPQKKQKSVYPRQQSPTSARSRATLSIPLNEDPHHLSATTARPARQNTGAQPHDALLQNATDQAAAVSRLAEGIGGTARPTRRDSRKRRHDENAADTVAAVAEGVQPFQKSPKRGRAKKSLQEVAHDIIEQAVGNATNSEYSKRRRRVTPEEAADHQIEPSKVTMGELTRDTGLGRKSATETAMQEINWDDQRARRKQEALELEQKRKAEKEERRTGKKRKPEVAARQHVPQQKVVNGMIVVDDDARVIDRAGDAQRAADDENVVVITDARITKRVNQQTVGRQPGLLSKAKASWDEEMTARFYKGLQMFGTDFMMVSALFPALERRHIKLKYVREEREHIEKIHEALQNRLPVNLAEFEEETGKEMIDPRQVEEEIRADEARMRRAHEEERARENEGAHPEDPAETALPSREHGSAEPEGEEAEPLMAAGRENRFTNVAEGIARDAVGKSRRAGAGRKGQALGAAGRKKGKDGSVAVSRKAAKAAKAAAVEGTGTVEAIGTVDEVPR